MATKKYKPNVVYIMTVDNQFYIGCHCCNRVLFESDILHTSGNYLRAARDQKLITSEEYKKRCKILSIEEYDSKEEALDREVELIAEYKDKYGSLCLNKCLGNKYGSLGHHETEEANQKRSLANRKSQICQYDKNGQLLKVFSHLMGVEKETGIPHANICKVLNGERPYAGGYIWKRA